MRDAFTPGAAAKSWRAPLRSFARSAAPTRAEAGLAAASSALLVLSFPDFNLWPLAWVGLVPLVLAVLRRGGASRAFLLGWGAGALFFYASCYWLTHAMIHYGGLPAWLAYPLLVPGALAVGLFPALWCLLLARAASRWGAGRALLLAPFAWAACEWARLYATGQLWNALGYSQAYTPLLIQSARWGGVYAVGFLLAAVNASVAYALLKRDARAGTASVAAVAAVALVVGLSARDFKEAETEQRREVVVVAVQPNVSANLGRTPNETAALVTRHLMMSASALRELEGAPSQAHLSALPRVVVWPESPMNFTYARDARFRETVARFARQARASVLFNSLEPAPAGGAYNSAVLVNTEGRLVAQYDKIRLLPFGEYVPLPRWLPAAWALSGIVGEFTPGEKYPLMPLGGEEQGGVRAGVFICFESAFPSISRTFAREGADVLVNISNDGYLGRTPVMRQHLANVVLRAVETRRPVLRVTNTGVSAFVTPTGRVLDATPGFEPATRTWTVARAAGGRTFYAKYGDLFAASCAAVTLLAALATLRPKRRTARAFSS